MPICICLAELVHEYYGSWVWVGFEIIPPDDLNIATVGVLSCLVQKCILIFTD